MNHKLENNYIAEFLSKNVRVLSPTSGSPAWGSDIRRKKPQRIWLWRPVGLECSSSTGLGKRETPPLEGTHKVSRTLWPSRKQELHISLGCTYLQILEGLLGRRGSAVAHCGGGGGPRILVAEAPENTVSVSSPRGRNFGIRTWPLSTAFRLQCWDASGQTNQQRGNTVLPISREAA